MLIVVQHLQRTLDPMAAGPISAAAIGLGLTRSYQKHATGCDGNLQYGAVPGRCFTFKNSGGAANEARMRGSCGDRTTPSFTHRCRLGSKPSSRAGRIDADGHALRVHTLTADRSVRDARDRCPAVERSVAHFRMHYSPTETRAATAGPESQWQARDGPSAYPVWTQIGSVPGTVARQTQLLREATVNSSPKALLLPENCNQIRRSCWRVNVMRPARANSVQSVGTRPTAGLDAGRGRPFLFWTGVGLQGHGGIQTLFWFCGNIYAGAHRSQCRIARQAG